MSEWISVNEVLFLAGKACGCGFAQIPGKKILFRGKMPEGETVTLCSPQSKMHPQGFYWVDITQEQARVLNETDRGLICFRLEGRNLLMVPWADLKQYLTADCMRYNTHEQHHWKLHIEKDRIKISGSKQAMPAVLYHCEADE